MKKLLLLIAALASAAAHAHPGDSAHAHGFAAGLLHPLTGADHLAAMVAVGMWSAMSSRTAWVAPVAFASLLSIGALAGGAGLAVPAVEPMIAASLLVLGLLLATRSGLPVGLAALLAGTFAFFHGAAHGTELSGAAALGGMLVATVLLHAAGLALGRWLLHDRPWLARASGGGVAVLGAFLLAGLA